MNITFHQLKVLHKAIEHGGVTKAAKMLHMTQPAVSNTLKTLEERIGAPILQRVDKHIEPTYIGQLLDGYFSSISDQYDQLQQNIAAARDGMVGKLRIGCVTTAKYILPNLLHDFILKYPNIQIDIEIVNKQTLTKHLQTKQVDCAIISHPPQTFEVNRTKIISDKLVIICSADESVDSINQLAQLKSFNWLVREIGSGTRVSMLAWFEQVGFTPAQTMLVNDTESIKQLVIAGYGISMVPLSSVQSELEIGSLQMIPKDSLESEHNWYMTTLPSRSGDILIERLVECIEQQ